MAPNRDTQTLILQLKKTIDSWRKEAMGISSDPNVLHWQKVNIESFASVLEDLNLSPTDLRRARDGYPTIAETVLHKVTFLANELHNLESDIRLGPLSPEIAQAAALKIEEQCLEVKPDIDKILGFHKILAGSSKTLKEKLNFYSFLPQARMQASGKNKSLFETGYSIFLTVSDKRDIEHDENVTNIFSYLAKVSKLQKAIEETEVPALPPIATSFLDQQLTLCEEACKQVKLFISFVGDYFQAELDEIEFFQKNLESLKSQPLTELLLEIQSQTDAASKCLQRFTHKKFLLEDIQKAKRLLNYTEQLHKALNDHFISYLAGQVETRNGLLNPQTLAIARSKKYFTGVKGLWRFIRMLLFSMNVNALISRDELEEKITEAVSDCSFFFGQESQDNHKISSFIDNFFSEYKRPFPHDELTDMTRKCIVTYATILEKVFIKYQPPLDKNSDDNEQNRVMSLGRLSSKIEIQADNLKKYRQKFEN